MLHGQESELYGDKAYAKAHYEAEGGPYRVKRTARRDAFNAARSRIRAHFEHAFRIVKHMWAFTKVCYRGLAKNTTRAYAAFALANLYLVRKRLVPQRTECRRERRQTRPLRETRANRHQTARQCAYSGLYGRLIGHHHFTRRRMHACAELPNRLKAYP